MHNDIHDDYIISLFYDRKDGHLNSRKWNACANRESFHDEYDYLINRFGDSESLYESLYRVKYHIETRPTCHYCNGHVDFDRRYHIPFKYTCSPKCAGRMIAMNGKKTCLEKYGVECVSQSKEVKEKIKRTCLEKYGVECASKADVVKKHIKESFLEKYGVECASKADVVKKHIKESFLEKYGVDSPMKTEEVRKKKDATCAQIYGTENPVRLKECQDKRKKTCLKKYGVECASQSKEVKEKIKKTFLKKYGYLTCAVHFKSKAEDRIYELLKDKFPDIVRQYVDKTRYPFHCDFYLPSLDMFIEYQGYTFTHGTHPYDDHSLEDKQRLRRFEKKALSNNAYKNAIDTWTHRDPLKRKTAKDNNLNYIELWSIEEAKEWLATL